MTNNIGGDKYMELEIREFVEYLRSIKKTSYNTVVSYERDLKKLAFYLENKGIDDFKEVTNDILTEYIEYLISDGNASTSVSRTASSIRTFYSYLLDVNKIRQDPARFIKAPKVIKKEVEILSCDEVELVLSLPDVHTVKGIRDKAILELMYSTGIRASELINVKVSDVDIENSYIVCKDEDKERVLTFSDDTKEWIEKYMLEARAKIIKDAKTNVLFANCRGSSMSRQGLWKLIKSYEKIANIDKEVTPHALRHACVANMVEC